MMRGQDYSSSIAFLNRFFGETEGVIELRACPNVKGSGGAVPLFSRDDATLEAFLEKQDREGFAVYFGLGTRKDGTTSGGKDAVQAIPALWVDIDCAKQGISSAAAESSLSYLPYPPSMIVNSGAGFHAYWMLEEAIDISDGDFRAVEAALRKLVLILAGDMQCAEVARILRVPGTLNSKDSTRALNGGEPILCEIHDDRQRVYDFADLCEWLETQRPVLHGKPREKETPRAVQESDPFVAYAREAGYEPAIDIDAELAAIDPGNSVHGIHPTQLRVSMSMAARGYTDDEIVDRLLMACSVHEPQDKKWNWTAEERAIRKMIETGRRKAENRQKTLIPSSAPMTNGNAALKLVHDRDAEEVSPKPKSDRESKSQTVAVGKAAIGVWQDRYGPVMHTDGLTYAYEDGIWLLWDDRLAQRLRAIIQEACASLRVEPKTSLLNAAKAYFMDRPELIKSGVVFDRHGLVIANDGTIAPATGEISDHSPEHYALYKVAAPARGLRDCPAWIAFLDETFSDKAPDEATAIISTVQEWFGAALIKEKSRDEKMGVLAHGPSRTGKTQIAYVARGLLGLKFVCGSAMRDLEGRFGSEPFLGKRGWIADDAIGEGEYLDADVYKKVVTGETFSVQCKGGRNVEASFGFPVMLTANNLPRVKDQSDAVYNRSLILPCTHVRPKTLPEPAGYNSIAEKIVAEELTGLLWWALEGWKRLSARGYYNPPPTMLDAQKGFEADNNPVGSWRDECLIVDAGCKVSRADLLASMNGWWSQEYGADAKLWSGRGFFPRLTKGISGYSKDKHDTTDDDGVRYLIGVRLTKAGLLGWRIHKDSRWGEGSKTSSDESLVNRDHQAPIVLEPEMDRRPRF